jgi:hypothetical protein
METQEMKQKIKDYFVESKEDKFTKVKTIKCKHNIIWKGKDLENKFMLTKKSYSNELKMGIDYRHKDEIDSVFFTFSYTNSDGGYPGMTNIKMYLIIDDEKNIELSEGCGFDHASQSSKVGDNYINVYLETAQLVVSMSDFIAIANAKKIEYSIRFGQGSLENIFTQNDLMIFKGFYNAAFDDEFGLFDATNYVAQFDTKVKKLFNDPTEKYFLSETRFSRSLFNKNDTLKLIGTDKGLLGSWSDALVKQINFNDLKVGIKHNDLSKAPSILIFPNAIVYVKVLKISQIAFCNIKRVDVTKGTIMVEDDKSIHKIDIIANEDLANFIALFVKSEISKNPDKVNYINLDKVNYVNLDNLIIKYSISESDLKRLKEIEKEKSDLGFFSIKKEKLKAESMNILKPYDVKFMDLGNLITEIKKS